MCDDNDQTKPGATEFDFSAFPSNTAFHERRTGRERRNEVTPGRQPDVDSSNHIAREKRTKKDRRRRIDPTTFEKQYTDDETEFMNAMQRFKESTGRNFPTYGDVLKVAAAIGYRRMVIDEQPSWVDPLSDEPSAVESASIDVPA
jgi:hypothetical protein